MTSNGIKPSVRSVMQLTGGKTGIVSGFLRDFHDKKDAEISAMTDELLSTDIAKILASAVDRKTASLTTFLISVLCLS